MVTLTAKTVELDDVSLNPGLVDAGGVPEVQLVCSTSPSFGR